MDARKQKVTVMHEAQKTGDAEQRCLVRALADNMRNQAAGRSVRLVEAHISWVLLAGHYAYKIKKAFNLGFLDFSSLQARHFYCEVEIRLNRRLASGIYLNVIAIGGSTENPVLGAQPAISMRSGCGVLPNSGNWTGCWRRTKFPPGI